MQVHILRERQQDIRHLEDDADCQSIQKLHGVVDQDCGRISGSR